jgi:uncharacterized protein YuzB (UPF0349 family)
VSASAISASLRFTLAVATVAAAAGRLAGLGAQQPPYDLVIRGGHVIDGTGNPWIAADVAIRGDRIVAVGPLTGATARREINARGLIVSPGFIDLHTHSDQSLLNDGNAESKVREGVTLDVIGESTSVAPRDGLPEASTTWTDFPGYWRALQGKGISMNVISEVSFQQIHLVVKGYAAGPATPAELERMKQLTARSMQEGAWGLVLIDQHSAHERVLYEEVMAQLSESGLTEVKKLAGTFTPEYCEDCGAPLFANAEGEIVHAELPEEADTHAAHFH